MSGSLRWRVGSVVVGLALMGFLVFSNFVPKEERLASQFFPDGGLRMGLDLQGGIHWVVGVDLATAVEREVTFIRKSLEEALSDAGHGAVVAGSTGAVLRISSTDTAALEAARALITEDFSVLQSVGSDGDSSSYELVSGRIDEVHELTMQQVLEVLRRRIDDPVRGIPDSVVARQGEDRVLVQIPGGQIDRDQARTLLKSTGFLEFKKVLDAADTEDQLIASVGGKVPEGQMIVPELDSETGQVVGVYLLAVDPDLTGDALEDARVDRDAQQRPTVSFRFNSEGAKAFGTLTGDNVGERIAIVLDKQVYSAPVIRSRITRSGVIEGRFTAQEAADLAVVLRAGSLSVPVVIEEERTVGPALGQDSINSGVRASALGLLLVIAFVGGYYRLAGGYAAIALLANLVMLIGLMSLFEATLTLPGIAGLVLTVGMAVDANVIIFERIREELRDGKTGRAAISTGFERATWTILDANITTLITAIILFNFGTGPIKGFAVTLSVGILTSVFSALVITRLLFQIHPGDRAQAVSI